MAFKIRPRKNGKFQAIVDAPGFPPVCGTFPDEGSARSWAIATNTTVLSGGYLPLKPKARALVKVVLAAYAESELPAQASEKSSRSRIRRSRARSVTSRLPTSLPRRSRNTV